MNSSAPRLPSPRRLGALLCAVAAAAPGVCAQGKGAPPWLAKNLPPGHPARVKAWHVHYEVKFHVKGEETKQGQGYDQKLTFATDVMFGGELDLVGPTTGKPPAGAAPKNAAEAMKVMSAMLKTLVWQTSTARPRGKDLFDALQHDVAFDYYSWSWLRTSSTPVGGEETESIDTDFERKVTQKDRDQDKEQGKTSAKKLNVFCWLSFDTEASTYGIDLNLNELGGEKALLAQSVRQVRSRDHNGERDPEIEKRSGGLGLVESIKGRCESASWTGSALHVSDRTMPEGFPESFTLQYTEPMLKISGDWCPVVTQTPAEWLAKHPNDATVSVSITVTRKK
ncbi:MAG: hypothetical protein U1E73_07075 [Planctomycetota bacterium]